MFAKNAGAVSAGALCVAKRPLQPVQEHPQTTENTTGIPHIKGGGQENGMCASF